MTEFDLDERSRMVLNAVVAYYIAIADPVGSRTLWKNYKLNFSPATVRNIMADLEDMGFLQHPHTSAGRVPTEKGYRFYVDFLRKQRDWENAQLASLVQSHSNLNDNVENLFSAICRLLSVNSQYIGVVLAPRLQDAIFKHVKFIRVREYQCLVVFVTDNGVVHERLIDVKNSYEQNKLDQMAHCLNNYLQGRTLCEVRDLLINKMAEEKDLYDRLLNEALDLSKEALEHNDAGDVYIEGKLNILNQPEFANVEKMKAIFQAFEEKSKIIHILDKCLGIEGLNILIGSENEDDQMRDCSLVTAPYKEKGRVIGTLGVIGPTRMRYSHVIPLVEYVAELVSKMLSKK